MIKEREIHFIGIGGAGMSGLARILAERGLTISGSDLTRSKYTDLLESMGVKIAIGHHEDNLKETCELVVLSTAIPPTNPEWQKAKRINKRIITRGELLGDMMQNQQGIAVAGAHGKTTTSSMIAWLLDKAGYNPTIAIGGQLRNFNTNAKLGIGSYFVAEADESDGSFLKLQPEIALITNIEDDHLDYYGSLERLIEAFQQFINRIPEHGALFLNADDCHAAKLGPVANSQVFYYGAKDNPHYTVKNIIMHTGGSVFDVYFAQNYLGSMEINVTGYHNILNGLGSLAVALHVGISFKEAADILSAFSGVERRMQMLGEANGIKVMDDYAHHPTEIKATLQAVKQTKPNRIVAVFQPHRYSRTQQLHEAFAASFSQADIIVITDIYSAGEKSIPGVDGQLIYKNAVKNNPNKEVYYFKKEMLANNIRTLARKDDLVLMLGAGDIWTIGHEILAGLEAVR